ncbi:hypothetical protein HPB48_011447 [Haemaphysalis longicornis]|uniref:Endonuclease/exonuclease/phosphatase domain-containing protein n=1 Tax=Haemaphysalis longicornis TaxID=44386 RepID=A0A9J6G4V4_HAELO|nr:hypothetical protein HPB48_011447 [Haemaphysalis longicornis]
MMGKGKKRKEINMFHIWQWNSRGIRQKRSALSHYAQTNAKPPDIISLQENNAEVAITEFQSFPGTDHTKVVTLVKKTHTAIEHNIDSAGIAHSLIEILPGNKSQPRT